MADGGDKKRPSIWDNGGSDSANALKRQKLNVEPVEDVNVKQESSDVRGAGQAALMVPGGLSLLSALFGAAHATRADALFKGALSSAADDLVKAAFSSAANAVKKESIADGAKAANKEPIADAAKHDFAKKEPIADAAKKEHTPYPDDGLGKNLVRLKQIAARGHGAQSRIAAEVIQDYREIRRSQGRESELSPEPDDGYGAKSSVAADILEDM